MCGFMGGHRHRPVRVDMCPGVQIWISLIIHILQSNNTAKPKPLTPPLRSPMNMTRPAAEKFFSSPSCLSSSLLLQGSDHHLRHVLTSFIDLLQLLLILLAAFIVIKSEIPTPPWPSTSLSLGTEYNIRSDAAPILVPAIAFPL